MEIQDKHHRVSFASLLGKQVEAAFDGGIASYKKPPKAILLDIDDTEDKVYGSGQLSGGTLTHWSSAPFHGALN